MPQSRDATVSCGCSGDEDEGGFDDYQNDDVEFLLNATPPEGFFLPDSEMGPEVGSPMNISGLVIGTPQETVNIPSINVGMYYDDQGNVEPEQQYYSEAEEDFLNKTIQSPESQSRQSSRSSYGLESPQGIQYNKGYESDSPMVETPPGFQYKQGRRAGLWDSRNRRGTACGGVSPRSEKPESNYEADSPPGFQYKKGRKAQLWRNEGGSGGSRLSTKLASSSPAKKNKRPAYADSKSGQASLIPMPAPRSAGSRSQKSPENNESTVDYASLRPARAPINYQQQNISNLKKYSDSHYTYVPKHKFPGKSPLGAQRRSEPNRLRRDIASEDLDVSDIPIDANIHPHHKESIEPMVAGMLSHVCGSRSPYVERTRPPIRGINETISRGRFACPALENARTWLPLSPSDDDVQVIHSPRPGSDLQDDDDELPEFEDYEQLCNNQSTYSKSSPKMTDKSRLSPKCIALSDSGSSSLRTPKDYLQTSDLKDFRSDSGKKAIGATSKFQQSPDIFDISNLQTSSPKTSKKYHQTPGCDSRKKTTKGVIQQSPDIFDLCDDSFEDMEKNVLEDESDDNAEESVLSPYPNFSQLSSSMKGHTAYKLVDLSTVEQLVCEENNDVSVAVGLSMPSRMNTTVGQSTANISVSSVREGKSNVSAAASQSPAYASMNLTQGGKSSMSAAADSSNASKNLATWGRSTAYIPVMAEDRDLDHTFAANMTMVQEQGLSLTSPPRQITNLLFPPDEGECQITAIIDSVPLDGAIVPMRPSRMKLPPSTTDKMDELAVIADSFIRSAPDRVAGTQLNVTLGTNLNVTIVVSPDATLEESPASSPGHGTGKFVSDPVEASRSIGAINSGRLMGETDFIMDTGPEIGTWIQLRGHREPSWFPGYYASLPSLPSPVTLLRTASEVLPRAWYATQSDSFQEEQQLTFTA